MRRKVPEHSASGPATIKSVLDRSGARPKQDDPAKAKIDYASRFALYVAECIAHDLKPMFPGITANTKRSARSVRGNKQLDINFSTPETGLALGISLKSVHTRDVSAPNRYTHNMKRNEEELRIESSGYHKRQPYAVMIAVLFLPMDSCTDGKTESSSFGSWVRKLRPYAGRLEPEDDIDKFEKIFIALYEVDGSDLRFFDVEAAPPRNSRPPILSDAVDLSNPETRLLSYSDFLAAAFHAYLGRNHAEFRWADGDEDPLDLVEDADVEDET